MKTVRNVILLIIIILSASSFFETKPVYTIEEDTVNVDCEAIKIRYSEQSLNDGYVEIKYNSDYDKGKYTYVVQLTGKDEEITPYQFTLNYINEWTRCPLPFNELYIKLYKWETEKYNKSFETDFNYSPKMITSIYINNVGDYKESIKNFGEKTTWVFWDDNSKILKQAEIIANESNNETEFVDNVFNWIYENITYDYSKTGSVEKRTADKYYGLISSDKIIETKQGVCSDVSGLMTIMLRSQGVPCRYVEGYKDGFGYHAWVQAYLNEKWCSYNITAHEKTISKQFIIMTIK